jgi:hypothetical protein
VLQEVWGYNSGVTTHMPETHIYRLRQKIEKDAAAPPILITEAAGAVIACLAAAIKAAKKAGGPPVFVPNSERTDSKRVSRCLTRRGGLKA